MRRSPQEVVNTLAYALKEGQTGDEFKVSDIVKKTSMNHVTITYYLDLIAHIQNNLPTLEVVEKKRNSFVKILKEVQLPFSEEEHVLLSLFDKGAFTTKTSVSIDGKQKDILDKLIGSSLLKQVSKKGYLLPEGIIKAAGLADKRAEMAINPSKQKIFDSGEIKIEEWAIAEKADTKADPNVMELSPVSNGEPINVCPIAV
jgi:hypothetical protein